MKTKCYPVLLYSRRLVARTLPFQGGEAGSIPVVSTRLTVCNVSPVRRPGLELGGRRFESCHTDHICRCSPLGGHWIVYPIKAGSIPVDGANFLFREIQAWCKDLTVNQ